MPSALTLKRVRYGTRLWTFSATRLSSSNFCGAMDVNRSLARMIPCGAGRIETMIKLKRAYDTVSRTDGKRIFVERLWPRGISKTKLAIDSWQKDVGPSTELRQWFSHDPEKWAEFRRRYFRELGARRSAWQPILSSARHGTVTLVYSSHDTQHNNAVALQEYLRRKSRRPSRRTRR
jgi:uncharacterized protein YeaO (DUF488 family)